MALTDTAGNAGHQDWVRLRLHVAAMPGALAISLLAGAVLLLLVWQETAVPLLAGWALALLAALALRLLVGRGLRRAGDAADPALWLGRYRASYFVHGLVWAVPALLMGRPTAAGQVDLMALGLVAVIGGALAAAAFDRRAALLFALPILLPLLPRLFAPGRPPLLALVVLLFLAVMLLSARRTDTARRELADQHRLLMQLLQSTPQGCWFIDNDAVTTDANPAMCELLGRSRAQIVGRSVFDFFDGDDLQRLQHEMATRPAGQASVYEVDIVRPDGSRRHCRNHATPIFDAAGRRVGAVGMWTDLSAHVQAQAALRIYEQVTNAITDMVSVVGEDHIYRMVNQAWCRSTGLTAEQVVGRRASEILPPLASDERRVALRQCLALQQVQVVRAVADFGGKPGHVIETSFYPGGEDAAGVRCVVVVTRDVDSEARALAALRAARDDAEAANSAKSRFLSQMSHELRTPMNAILGFAQLLDADPQPPLAPQQQAQVREILGGARHLLELINEVLDLGRIEAGRLQVERRPVALQALAAECLGLMQPLAQRHGVRLLPLQGATASVDVLADSMRLRQVLLNLLGNAIKYNRAGGEVELVVRQEAEGDTALLSVRDSGRGLTAEQQQRLFQPFERLDAGRSGIEGTGIGLALSRRLVEAMGGAIGVHSAAADSGSLFWVRLPLAHEALPAAPPAAAPLPAPSVVAAPATVLYIEDNDVNVLLMQAMLERLPGLRLLSAAVPADGLVLAQSEKPALLLLDIQMPGMDGFEVLARLRADPATRAIPAIAVSANARQVDIDAALAAGFSAYLTKPVDLRQLLDTVQATLAGTHGAQAFRNSALPPSQRATCARAACGCSRSRRAPVRVRAAAARCLRQGRQSAAARRRSGAHP